MVKRICHRMMITGISELEMIKRNKKKCKNNLQSRKATGNNYMNIIEETLKMIQKLIFPDWYAVCIIRIKNNKQSIIKEK